MMTFGGDWSDVTISEMKLAVMPMMLMRAMASIALTTMKVAPRAPKVEGIFRGGRGSPALTMYCPDG
jgi:hypothetical protein